MRKRIKHIYSWCLEREESKDSRTVSAFGMCRLDVHVTASCGQNNSSYRWLKQRLSTSCPRVVRVCAEVYTYTHNIGLHIFTTFARNCQSVCQYG